MSSWLKAHRDLNHEQRGIVMEPPYDKSLFIEGPPGSGKTLISLLRLQTIVSNNIKDPLLLMYTNALLWFLHSSLNILGIKDNIRVNNKDKYFWSFQGEVELPHFHDDMSYPEKYNQLLDGILAKIQQGEIERNKFSVIVVDEAQDLMDKEWQILRELSNNHVLCVDYDQNIFKSSLPSSVRQELDGRKLSHIYRFGYHVAGVAQGFSKANVQLVSKVIKEEETKVMVVDKEQEQEAFDAVDEIIRIQQRANARIGIIGPSHNILNRVNDYLASKGQTVIYKRRGELKELQDHDFMETSPIILTPQSAKGIEFDITIVIGFQNDDKAVWAMRKEGTLQRTLYVALTRANHTLYVFRYENSIPELYQLPDEHIHYMNEEEEDEQVFYGF